MDVAERVFAEQGYLGASMRLIAEEANVTQALINYYFGSKQNLFEETFARRGATLMDRYAELLIELTRHGKRAPTVRELVRAFIKPQIEMHQHGAEGRNFIRMQARLHHEPQEIAFQLRRRIYDAVTRQYVEAFEKALPDVSAADVNWRVTFMIGTFLYMLSGVDRLEDLSGGRFHSGNDEEMLERMVQFLTAGMEAPATVLAAEIPKPGSRARPKRT
ncbi:TetR/AcrR family transcriptional regulator [Paraburkholderia oxyphila]|uniref:TetR/AcrR family transcriptional regulator n=1 Tax=Paraburkholderia oxyphila TaxID=614212 RepID=UPI001428C339|nr:TetR/AcrR family transcriptional regulator [Paraburkholderia oxyphila]